MKPASVLATLAIVLGACSSGAATTAPSGSAAAPSAAAPSTGTSAAAPTPAASTAASAPAGAVTLTLWTKEGGTQLDFVKKLASDYTAAHPNVVITVVNKDVEKLRTEFQAASLAQKAPELLWTVADHVGPFTTADIILPLDGLIDSASYLPGALAGVQADGKTWGAPISYGNQLMLYWNKNLAGNDPPADFAALVAKAKTLTDAPNKKFGLVFNQTESFWLIPFIGGFGGKVFADDGKTPTLDTDAVKNALKLFHDLKFVDQVTPAAAKYEDADGAFKNGNAAFIINGDWTLSDYAKLYPDKLGVGPLPKLTGGDFPKPYTAGAFFMVSKLIDSDPAKKAAAIDFIKWATAKDQQIAMVKALQRLPGNNEALNDPIVTGDKLLNGAAEAVKLGIPQPTNLEMRCVFDRLTDAVKADFQSASSDPVAIAATAQKGAESDVKPGGKCATS
jgi:arabinogalactan oligomer / maltooligosaccharide transport system substrate-binding protein